MKKETTQTTSQYVEKIIKEYTESLEEGGYIEKSTENMIISGRNGYIVNKDQIFYLVFLL